MKLITVVLLCSAILYVKCEDTKEKVQKLTTACQAETGASDADVSTMFKYEAATTPEGKCLRACVMKQLGVMDADGKLHKETAMSISVQLANGDEEKLKQYTGMVEECLSIEASSDHCEAAEDYVECMRDHAKKENITLESYE